MVNAKIEEFDLTTKKNHHYSNYAILGFWVIS